MILIEDLLSLDAIFPQLEAPSMRHAFKCLVDKLAINNHSIDKSRTLELLVERERLGSTAIGNGVALPHALIDGVSMAVGCFARLKNGISYDSPDDELVDLLFLLLVDKERGAQHARTIAYISRIMSQKALQRDLRRAKTRNDMHELFKSFESSNSTLN